MATDRIRSWHRRSLSRGHLLLLLIVGLCIGFPDERTIAQTSADASGFFKVVPPGSPDAPGQYIYLERKGDTITGKDLRTGGEIVGSMRGLAGGTFTISKPKASAGKLSLDEPPTIDFSGSLSEQKLRGKIVSPSGSERIVDVLRLPSLWQCGNHVNPSHAADSEDQMRQLSKDQGCAGWRKARPPDSK